MRIVVIGDSGLVGATFVATLRQRDHDVFAASHRSRVDTITGQGLEEAMPGAQTVIDVINSSSFDNASQGARMHSQ